MSQPASKPSMCSLCRVTATAEHLESGWHKYNARIFASGKMPIPELNYNLYEKPKEEAAALAGTTVASGPASGPAAGSAPTDANKRNVNAWHWEENDYTNWAKDVIKKKLLSVRVEQGIGNVVKVTEVSKLSGDAYVNTRKGRVFAGYEFKINLEWTGEVLDASGNVTTTYKGKAHMPEVSADVDDCDFEVSSIKLEGNESPEKDALLKLFQTAGRKAIVSKLKEFHSELNELAKNPSSFKPPASSE